MSAICVQFEASEFDSHEAVKPVDQVFVVGKKGATTLRTYRWSERVSQAYQCAGPPQLQVVARTSKFLLICCDLATAAAHAQNTVSH